MEEPAAGDGPRRLVTISNRRGLHARAAARFVKTAERFQAEVSVARLGAGKESVSGLSIMGLMMLAAGTGVQLCLRATGPDAEAALDALERLIADKFDED